MKRSNTWAILQNSALFRSAFIYTFANSIDRSIPFILMPILTRHLSLQDYGIVALYSLQVSFLLPVISIESRASLTRLYYDKAYPLATLASQSLLISLFTMITVVITLPLWGGPVSRYTEFPQSWLWAVITCSFCQVLTQLRLTSWRIQQNALLFCMIQIGQTALNLGLSLYFIMILRWAWEGRILGHLTAIIIFSLITTTWMARDRLIRIRFERAALTELLQYGLPLVPHAIGALLIVLSDRLTITHLLRASDLGIYTAGAQIAMVIHLLGDSFERAFTPWLFEKMQLRDAQLNQRIVLFIYFYFLFLLAAAVGLALVARPFMSIFVGSQFQQSAQYVAWLGLAGAFTGMYLVVASIISFSKRTGVLSKITILCGIASLGLNYLLTSRYGLGGAAIATVSSSAALFFVTWMTAAGIYPMPWWPVLNKLMRHPFRTVMAGFDEFRAYHSTIDS